MKYKKVILIGCYQATTMLQLSKINKLINEIKYLNLTKKNDALGMGYEISLFEMQDRKVRIEPEVQTASLPCVSVVCRHS